MLNIKGNTINTMEELKEYNEFLEDTLYENHFADAITYMQIQGLYPFIVEPQFETTADFFKSIADDQKYHLTLNEGNTELIYLDDFYNRVKKVFK